MTAHQTAPTGDRLGCHVLDKDGHEWDEIGFTEDGYAEWRAIARAEYLAHEHPQWGPYRVLRVMTETLHTIPAPEAK